MATNCTCPECGSLHPANRPPREVITSEQSLRLFRDTYLAYKAVHEVLLEAADSNLMDNHKQLAIRQLHVAVLRKYILETRENVYLKRIVNACLDLLPESHAPAEVIEVIGQNLKKLSTGLTSLGIAFYVGDRLDSRDPNQVVIDYLYGILLHSDYGKAVSAVSGSPLNNLISSSEWFANANLALVEISFLVERTIGFLDKGEDFLRELPELSFTKL